MSDSHYSTSGGYAKRNSSGLYAGDYGHIGRQGHSTGPLNNISSYGLGHQDGFGNSSTRLSRQEGFGQASSTSLGHQEGFGRHKSTNLGHQEGFGSHTSTSLGHQDSLGSGRTDLGHQEGFGRHSSTGLGNQSGISSSDLSWRNIDDPTYRHRDEDRHRSQSNTRDSYGSYGDRGIAASYGDGNRSYGYASGIGSSNMGSSGMNSSSMGFAGNGMDTTGMYRSSAAMGGMFSDSRDRHHGPSHDSSRIGYAGYNSNNSNRGPSSYNQESRGGYHVDGHSRSHHNRRSHDGGFPRLSSGAYAGSTRTDQGYSASNYGSATTDAYMGMGGGMGGSGNTDLGGYGQTFGSQTSSGGGYGGSTSGYGGGYGGTSGNFGGPSGGTTYR